MKQTNEQKISTTQAANIIGVSAARICQLASEGALKAEPEFFGKQKRVLFNAKDVYAYKEKRDRFKALA